MARRARAEEGGLGPDPGGRGHEYWIVDPELNAIEIHRRVNEAFPRVAEVTAEAGDVLTTPLLPGFAAPLADLCASPFST